MPRARKKPETIESLSASVASLASLVEDQGRRIEMLYGVIRDFDGAFDTIDEAIAGTNDQTAEAYRVVADKVREVVGEINEGRLLAGQLVEAHNRLSDRVDVAELRIEIFGSVLHRLGHGEAIDAVEEGLIERYAATPDAVPEGATAIPMRRPIRA